MKKGNFGFPFLLYLLMISINKGLYGHNRFSRGWVNQGENQNGK